MKRTTLTLASFLMVSPALADIPVIDASNYAIAKKTSETTDQILDTNKEVLKTVQDSLSALTGDRSGVTNPMQSLGVGSGFSVSTMPSLDTLISDGVPNFGNLSGSIANTASKFINALQLVKSISGQADSKFSGDQSYQQLMSTVLGISALITGAEQAVNARTSALQTASKQIGTANDIKGSIDQNSQLQVQTGLTINELIGVMNGAVQSLQAENQRKLVDISNTRKALTYDK